MPASTSLAAPLIKPGQYEIREYPLPDPAPGWVLVKMEMSDTCGTDKHTFQGLTTQYGGRELEFPIIQGHQNVGAITTIGGKGLYSDFEGLPLRAGDRVVVGANVACGECYDCRQIFPDFRRAYSEDSLSVREFDSCGPTRRTLRQFIGACSDLDSLVRDFLIPHPDVS
jgi:threonine dehydrogenase-like Zn-dependent dehydrogenase